MKLSDEELRIVERASRNETIWRYTRFLELAFWIGMIFAGFWLFEQPDFLESELLRIISAGICGMGGAGLASLALTWHNKERQLLLKITSDSHRPTD